MKILDRYLAGAVIGGTILTLAVLLPLLGFFILADEIDKVGENNYQFADAMIFVALSLPRYTFQIFPIATLIGALVGLGALASRSELVAMRAAGVSISRIVYAALKGGALLAVVAVLVGEGVAPVAEQKALQWRSEAQSGQVTLTTPYGFWARDGSAYINIREILPGANLRDIYIYEFDGEQRLTLATHAKDARYVQGSWLLEGISRSRVSDDGVEVTRVAQAGWDSLLSPGLLDLVILEPHVLSVWGLFRYVRFMAENGQDAGPYEVALWSKVVHPFLILAMIFMAIPILFGSARSTGIGPRIFLGILVGIGFYLVSRTFSYLALLFDLSPLLAAITPPLLFLVGAVWVLKRVG
ncbi:MAG: LPS export ABC transporter permease LptG [Pseudomonadota bacterium]|nr:LPS export ABC transporter permease LptG [Pseudomonadota bacterium]